MKHLSLAILSTAFILSSAFSSTLGSTIKDNSLIVYNGNLGLVHEERSLTLEKDDTTIVYDDVASSINTDSVNVKLPDSLQLYSQQYRFDKLTQAKLLNAHIGKKVEVKVLKDTKNFKVISAILLSSQSGSLIVKTANSKIITVNANDIIFQNIPDTLITKPSLVWNIKTDRDLDTNLEIDYLIKNISWKSNYILNVSKTKADLSGWITIDNRSGKRFNETSLNVLAGDLNQAQPEIAYKQVRHMAMAMNDSAPVEHKAVEGYHLYTIPFKVTLANNEKTQIKFIDKRDIKIQRSYSSTLSNPLYLRGESKYDVTQFINLKGLDIALPKGVVRTYSKSNGRSLLLGESSLSHTPKDSPIRLKIGKNFDIKVTQSIVSRDDSKYRFNASVNYSVKNSSDEAKIVELLVPFNRHEDSKIKTTMAYKFKKGNLIVFNVKVAPNSTYEFSANYISKK